MKTEDLIAAMAADTRPGPGVAQRAGRSVPLGAALAVAAFLALWGTRPDLTVALTAPPVLKTLLPLALAGLAAALALTLARPEGRVGVRGLALAAFVAGLLAGLGWALAGAGFSGLVSALWTGSLITCLLSIPVLALPLLAAMLWALAGGAPGNPALAGAVGGLAAGGLAAGLYSLYCDQDAALFAIPAYATAVLVVAALGALAGRRVLAW